MPFGFPVVPEVYRMKRGFSAGNACAVWSAEAAGTTSCHQRSRPSVHSTSFSPRLTTSTCSTVCCSPSPRSASAWSTAGFSAETRPLRYPPSAVMTSLAPASSIRERRLSALNPPKTTEWMAPTRATASIAAIASGIIGR